MSATVGLVIPAYRPDLDLLEAYVGALHETVDPTVIRIELDDPSPGVERRVDRLDATVSIAHERRGKGLAITAGFEALGTDILAFLDADAATPPASVRALLEPLQQGSSDLTIGNRRHPDAAVTHAQRPVRLILSGGFVRLARLVTGIPLSDFQCGAKALTRDCWEGIKGTLFETGFGWDLELLWVAASRGYDFHDVPIEWHDRPNSTVPPVRTTMNLSILLGRIGLARVGRRTTARRTGTTLLEHLEGV